MSGQELADRLAALYPTARVIYMSGYPHEIVGDPRLAQQNALFLQKPFTREKLARAVREVLGRAAKPPGTPGEE
jgi:FixJ family two-component response regulator